jgi:L-2,4-diaminobutyric acid acetyltransferase
MLDALLTRPVCGDVRWLETTITPSNASSQKLFRTLATRLETECRRGNGFSEELFDGEHEPEELYRIGPFTLKTQLREGSLLL